ncbi:hypothetical protein IFM89_018405 [Coptis chinensis]|uniref:Uncharacterized protein n=1 Tax=Coptis chinensis TaxID=261450 RepID=A0A835HIF0_9MAGN|nr:hypothetical protein IFM89_018405 [Coptis chinensis]
MMLEVREYLEWHGMASSGRGMESYYDGYEIVLSRNPSITGIITAQSNKMTALTQLLSRPQVHQHHPRTSKVTTGHHGHSSIRRPNIEKQGHASWHHKDHRHHRRRGLVVMHHYADQIKQCMDMHGHAWHQRHRNRKIVP